MNLRDRRHYLDSELTLLLGEVRLGTPLSDLERKLRRSQGAIAKKLIQLSHVDSERWPYAVVGPYQQAYWKILRDRYGETYRAKIVSYLRKHPDATRDQIVKSSFGWCFELVYGKEGGGISQARQDASVDRDAILRERKKQPVRSYLRKHRSAQLQDLFDAGVMGRHTFEMLYPGGVTEARKDAGLFKDQEYISGAEASRRLGLSRQAVSQLFCRGKLEGYKLGRDLYISAVSVDTRLHERSLRYTPSTS